MGNEESLEFQISYDGPAVEDHQMEIHEFAEILSSFGNLIEECNKEIYGDRTQISLCVKGGVKKGSIDIKIQVVLQCVESLINILNSGTTSALVNLLQLIGIPIGCATSSISSLIAVVCYLKSRKITEVRKISKEDALITTSDGEEIKTNAHVLDLVKNVRIRKSLDAVIAHPLKKKGMETFSIKKESNLILKVEKKDAQYYAHSEASDTIEEKKQRSPLYVKIINFQDPVKSKFIWADKTASDFSARIRDDNFVERVKKGEPFGAGDLLIVDLVIRKLRTAEGVEKLEYEIIKVIDHKGPEQQEKLF